MSTNHNNRNRNNNQNRSRKPNGNGAPKSTTAQRAEQSGAKVPADKVTVDQAQASRERAAKAAKEVDYLKHPEKFPNWNLMLPTEMVTSFEDEIALKFRLSLVTQRFTQFMIDVYDTNGNVVSLFTEDGKFEDPVDANGNPTPLFDEEGNPVDLDEHLEQMRLLAIEEAKADPEVAVRNMGKLVDIMCDKFSTDPVALRKVARKEGFEPIIQLAILYTSILGEFERSES